MNDQNLIQPTTPSTPAPLETKSAWSAPVLTAIPIAALTAHGASGGDDGESCAS